MQEMNNYMEQQQQLDGEQVMFVANVQDIQDGSLFSFVMKKQLQASEQFKQAWDCMDQETNIEVQQSWHQQKVREDTYPNNAANIVSNIQQQKADKFMQNCEQMADETENQPQIQQKQRVLIDDVLQIVTSKQQQAMKQLQNAWNNIDIGVAFNSQKHNHKQFKQQNQIINTIPIQSEIKQNNIKHIRVVKKNLHFEKPPTQQSNQNQNQINIQEFKRIVENSKNVQEKGSPNPQFQQQSSAKLQKRKKEKGISTSKIYSIQKQETRKYSLKRSAQADNQMLANIQFLKNLKGINGDSQKKEWKQPKYANKSALSQLKQVKRKQIHALGFTQGSASMISSKQSYNPIYVESPTGSSTLPDIRNSRKKGQIFKPAAFSIYSIQKSNELFYNKLAQ